MVGMLTLAVFGRRSPNTALSTFDRRAGVSLFELMIVIAIVALLSMIALPQYQNYSDRAKVSRALGDIGKISTQIEMFRLRNNDRIPDSLLELGVDIPEDPWEQPYEYLKIAGRGPGVGGLRKDGKLNPLNSDFDLYSLGKDGDSKGPLSAKASHDDIIRANDGAYIGLGEDY